MKICISSESNTLDSKVDARFGRCRYFIILDTETLEFEAIQNPNIETMGGAGIQSAQLAASKQVKAVLAGNIGPNAFQTLQAAGIDIFSGVSGTVKEAVEKYKKGEFKTTQNPSVNSKYGMPGKNK
ncbi:MAG: NifB/NifX family molybdenum-iron cluster-binding protein [Candidatus Omnitrophota bacterium]|jgi:predicted Fe-Mo cluster-binding NifX family protein